MLEAAGAAVFVLTFGDVVAVAAEVAAFKLVLFLAGATFDDLVTSVV